MEQEKVLILNLLKELTSELDVALNVDSLDVVTSLEALSGRAPVYVLVDSENDLPKVKELESSRVICFSSVGEVKNFLRNRGDVIFNPSFAKSDVGRLLLERFFSGSTVVQMETAYDGILKNSQSTKFSSPLTVGHYSDIITKFAHSEKADITGLRTFLSSVSSFFAYLTKNKVSWFPLDVDYGTTEDALVVQITSPVTKIYKDYIIKSLNDTNPRNPFTGLMDICTKQSHAVDLYYLEKANKLVITGVWLKDISALDSNFFPTLLTNQLYTFEELKTLRKNTLTSKIVLTQEEMNINYDVIPGTGVEVFEEEPFEENKNLITIKAFVDFIKMFRENEKDAKPKDELVLRDIARYLRKYPDQREVNKLEQSDREAILRCFSDQNAIEELEETITTVKSSIDKEDFLQTVIDNLTELEEEDAVKLMGSPQEKESIQKIKGSKEEEVSQTIKGSKEEEEVSETIRGSKEEEEVSQTIKGSKEEEEVSQTIKGSEEEKDEEIVISGSNEEKPGVMKIKSLPQTEKEEKQFIKVADDNVQAKEAFVLKGSEEIDLGDVREAMRKKNSKPGNEDSEALDWEVQKRKVTEKVAAKIQEIKDGSNDKDIESLEEEIITVFKEEMGEDSELISVAKAVTEDASNKLISEKLKAVDDAKLKMSEQRNEKALALKDEQIARMTKVIDRIKEENNELKSNISSGSTNVRTENTVTNGDDTALQLEIKAAQNELRNSQKALGLKELAIEKLKESQQIALDNKDKQLDQMQERLDAILDSKSSDDTAAITSEMKKVSNENRLLQSQLDVKDRTIENMNRRMEESAQSENNRSLIELEKAKEQNRVALDAMKAFKAEKSQLEGKLRLAERDARQKETELNIEKAKSSNTGGDSVKELREKDREIQAIKIEQNKLNDQNKTVSIRCKQLEQKMKFLNAQVESTKKGGRNGARGGAQGAAGSSGRENKLAVMLKQAETAKEKMAMDTQRLSAQVDTKKKEALGLKTEINTLKNKITDLEQKLAKSEKKAA